MHASSTYYSAYTFDIATGIPLFWDEVPWDGKWVEVKKGREGMEKTADAQFKLGQQDQATRAEQLAKAEPTLTQFESVGPGGMGVAAGARYASDLRNIDDTYGKAREVGLRRLGQRGMGSAPTGAESSLMATGDMSRAHDENDAYLNALQQTRADQLEAVKARLGLQSIYNPNQAYEGASQSNFRRSQMGSTLGDVGTGLNTAAGLALSGAAIHG